MYACVFVLLRVRAYACACRFMSMRACAARRPRAAGEFAAAVAHPRICERFGDAPEPRSVQLHAEYPMLCCGICRACAVLGTHVHEAPKWRLAAAGSEIVSVAPGREVPGTLRGILDRASSRGLITSRHTDERCELNARVKGLVPTSDESRRNAEMPNDSRAPAWACSESRCCMRKQLVRPSNLLRCSTPARAGEAVRGREQTSARCSRIWDAGSREVRPQCCRRATLHET
jgi:hypothetical protein